PSCKEYLDADGKARALNEEKTEETRQCLADSARQAMRTLAFAYAQLPTGTPTDEDGLHALRDSLEHDLVYLGFVAIRDPLRADVKAALQECRRAGIDVKMGTGDNVETAPAIAAEIGLGARPGEPGGTPEAVGLT